MAENSHVEEVGLIFNADGSADYVKSLAGIRSEMDLLYAEYVREINMMDKDATETEKLSAKKRLLEQQIDSQQKKVAVLRHEVDTMTKSEGDNSIAIEKKKKDLAYAESQLAKYEKGIKATTEELKKHSEWTDKASKKVSEFGEKTTEVGKKLSYVSAAVSAMGVASLKAAGDFDVGIRKINSLDVNAAESKIKGIEKNLLDLSGTTGQSASELTEATYQMGSALGELKDNTVEYVEVATKAAIAGFTDAATAVNGLTTVYNTYGMSSVEDMKKVSDQMLMAQNLGKTTFGEIAQSVGNVIPIFKQVGGTTEELFAAYAILTKNGIQTAQATTGIKAALSNIINPSEAAMMAADKLGLKFDAAAIQSMGFAGFLAEVNSSLKNAAPAYAELGEKYAAYSKQLEGLQKLKETDSKNSKKYNEQIAETKQILTGLSNAMEVMGSAADSPVAAYSTLFGSVEALNSMLVLASDEGISQYQGALESMANATGATDAAFEKMNNGFNANMQKLTNSLTNLAISFGQVLIPMVLPLIEKVKEIVDGFAQLDEGTKILITTIGIIIAIIGPLLVVIGKISIAIGTLIKLFPGLQAAMGPIGIALAALTLLIIGITAAVSFFTRDTRAANQALKEFADDAPSLSEAMRGVQPALTDINNLLSDTGKTLSQLDSSIRTTESAITAILSAALSEQRTLRQSDLDSIRQYNTELLKLQQEKLQVYRDQQLAELRKLQLEEQTLTQEAALQRLANAQAALNQTNAITEEAYTAQLAIVENKYKAMGQVGSTAYQEELISAKAFYDQSIAENQSYYTQSLATATDGAAQWIQADADKWSALNSGQRISARQYADILGSLNEENTKMFLQMVATTVAQGGVLSEETKNVAAMVLGAFDELPNNLKDAGTDALAGLLEGMDEKLPELKGLSDMTGQEMVNALKGVLEISSPSMAMNRIGQQAIEGIKAGMEAKQTTLLSSAGSIGKNLIEGVWAGINGLRSWFSEKIGGFFTGTVATIKAFFGIQSPSKLMSDEIGKPMVEGVAAGILKNSGIVSAALDALAPSGELVRTMAITATSAGAYIGATAAATSAGSMMYSRSGAVGSAESGSIALSDETLKRLANAFVQSLQDVGMDKTAIYYNDREIGRMLRGVMAT